MAILKSGFSDFKKNTEKVPNWVIIMIALLIRIGNHDWMEKNSGYYW